MFSPAGTAMKCQRDAIGLSMARGNHGARSLAPKARHVNQNLLTGCSHRYALDIHSNNRHYGCMKTQNSPDTIPDIANINWDLSDVELADIYGWRLTTCRALRSQFGHRKVPKSMRAVDWNSVDWSLNNQQIARKFGANPSIVARVRVELNKPQSPGYVKFSRCAISKEELNRIDWTNTADVEIAQKWNLSRERVRQIRLQLGIPASARRSRSVSPENMAILTWIEKNRDILENMRFMDAFRMCPIVTVKFKFKRMADRAGVKLISTSIQRRGPLSMFPIDWNLPNLMLAYIWGLHHQRIANERSIYKKPKSKWIWRWNQHPGVNDPEFIRMVKEQLAMAAALKVNSDPHIWKRIESWQFLLDEGKDQS